MSSLTTEVGRQIEVVGCSACHQDHPVVTLIDTHKDRQGKVVEVREYFICPNNEPEQVEVKTTQTL